LGLAARRKGYDNTKLSLHPAATQVLNIVEVSGRQIMEGFTICGDLSPHYTARNGFLLLLLLFKGTANGVLPYGSGTTVRHLTKMHISHKITHHAQTERGTQSCTIKDTLHIANTKQKQ
jgi:hypothetical protein